MFQLPLTTQCFTGTSLTVDHLTSLKRPLGALTIEELKFATYCAYAQGMAVAKTNMIPLPAPPSDEEDYF